MKESGIYQFKNKITNCVYIGSSDHLHRRKTHHFRLLRLNKHHCVRLQEAWNAYGEAAFDYEVLELCAPDVRVELEQRYLDKMKNHHHLLYNTSLTAGSGGSYLRGTKKNPDAVERSAAGNRGKKRTAEQIAAKRLVVGKEYCAKDPNGVVHAFKNISLFCEENGLQFRNLHAVLVGKRRSHKGWTRPDDARGARIQQEVTLVDPLGNKHHVTRISKFAKDNGLRDGAIYDMIKGKTSQTKGWRLLPGNQK
jgi:group I intron endonuclease